MEDRKARRPRPPEPPPFTRSILIDGNEWAGLVLLLLLPVLALFGAIDGEDSRSVEAPRFSLQVDYPSRIRVDADETLKVLVRNTGPEPLARLTVALEQGYLSNFEALRFDLPPRKVTQSAYEIDLEQLLPGESRLIRLDLKGRRFGRHEGRVQAVADDGRLAQVDFSTFIFP